MPEAQTVSGQNSGGSESVLEKELMYRVKSRNSMFQRLANKAKLNARLIFVVTCLVIASIYVAMYMGGSKSSSEVKVTPDRSENYNVRILPADLSDDALDALPKSTFSYLAMIDAGSSGCRAHVYRYGKLGALSGPLYVLPHHVSKKVKPGLSSFALHPNDAGASLQGLVDFIKSEVPESDWSVTPIWLKATAGLRMIEKSQSDAVLESVRSFLSSRSNSPFLFRPSYARIISGNEEGGFGWIAYNYLRKIIGPKKHVSSSEPSHPYAVVEMGGASAQVSQLAPNKEEAEKIPEEYRFSFTIESDTYHLYTHSYLGFGAEQAREQLNKLLTAPLSASDSKTETIKDPCLNAGFDRPGTVARKETYEGPQGIYFNISGSADADGICHTTVKAVFGPSNTDTCDHKSRPAPFSFKCTHQPAFVSQSKNILLFENFYYASSALGVKPVHTTTSAAAFPLITTPAHMLEATNKFCALPYSTLGSSYPLDSQPKDVNTKMCFVGSYGYSFLTSGLQIPADKHVTIAKDVGKSEIEWALGAAYKETADFLKRTNLRPT